MRRLCFFLAAAIAVCVVPIASVSADDFTVQQIMQRAHLPRRGPNKERLYKVVTDGKATKEEKQELLELYQALAKAKPPKGSLEDWQKATAALVAAAQEIACGEVKDGEKLQAALDCKACHAAHKPVYAQDGTLVEDAGSFGAAAPPQFVKVSNISKDKLSITVYHYQSQPVMTFQEEIVETGDVKKTVKVPITKFVNELRQTVISLQYVRLFDTAGEEIKGDDFWKRLKPGVTLLRQTEATKIDPELLKLLSPKAMILAPSLVEVRQEAK